MTTIVLDTNVVVSAHLKQHGLEAKVLQLVFAGYLTACVSPSILAEYELVLQRKKFRFDPVLINLSLTILKGQSILVKPRHQLAIAPDEADNRFLECAETAKAEYLVTGNKRHFPTRWKQTEVVNARELIERIAPGLRKG